MERRIILTKHHKHRGGARLQCFDVQSYTENAPLWYVLLLLAFCVASRNSGILTMSGIIFLYHLFSLLLCFIGCQYHHTGHPQRVSLHPQPRSLTPPHPPLLLVYNVHVKKIRARRRKARLPRQRPSRLIPDNVPYWNST